MANHMVQIQNYNFAVNLTKHLRAADENHDLIFSPASIAVALALCYDGAGGETKSDIQQTIFGVETTNDEINDWVDSILNLTSTEVEDFALKIDNRFYVGQKFELKRDFLDLAKKFGSEISKANFDSEDDVESDPTKEIREWLDNTTSPDRIAEFVHFLSSPTKLLILNALHFKGAWRDQFLTSCTKKQNFFVMQDKTIEVDMMTMTRKKGFFEDDDVQVLQLLYNETPISMILILPKNGNLSDVVDKLDGQKLKQWLDNVDIVHVHMKIPRFKIGALLKLNQALSRLGLSKLFDTRANFSGMIEQPDNVVLSISNIFHKATIEVDENGTEAAPAESVKMVYCCNACCPNNEPKQFIADHPFLFLVIADNNGDKTVLLMGEFHGRETLPTQ